MNVGDVTLIGRMIFARLGGMGEYSEATIIASYQKINLLGTKFIKSSKRGMGTSPL